MPIGSTVVYNAGDLILSTVSSSGNTFQENKIAAATSSIILFNSNGLLSSQSLNLTTVGTASYVSGSTSIITNLTASNISASGGITGSLFGTSSWATNSISSSYFSGSVFSASNAFVSGTLTVTGQVVATAFSSSTIYITSSTLIIGDNIITLNAATPALRYAGIEMYDSGSSTLSSLLWDSQNNYFFVSSSGASANRQVILGPVGESALTTNYIPLISGSNNITNSIIYQTAGGNIGIGMTTPIGKLNISSSDGPYTLAVAGTTKGVRFNTNATTTILQGVDNTFTVSYQPLGLGGSYLVFQTNGATEAVRIDANGNVGIGTSIPINRLDVVGNISASVITASLFSGSHSGSTFGTSSWAQSASNAVSAVTATTANALNTGNSYTIAGLTVNGNISASGVITASNVNVTQTLGVGSNVTVGSSLTVTGTSTFNNTVTVNSSISASSFVSASLFVGPLTGSTFGTASWANNSLTASSISSTSNAFVQGGNSFGATATLGTNDANSLAFETNGTTQLTINSGGRIAIGPSVNPSYKLSITDTHDTSDASSSLYIVTNQNQSSATSGNDNGIESKYNVNAVTSSTALQNQAMYNALFLLASGSYSGSYRAMRNGVSISNTCSIDASVINTYLTNQVGGNIPTFSISNWFVGTSTYIDSAGANATGSIGSLYHHYLGTPFSGIGSGSITATNSFGVYIARQKQTNITNGYGIYQVDTGDLNIFAGRIRIGSTTSPVNALDVSGNISCSVITASLFSGSVSGSIFGTSSWAQSASNAINSQTASYLTPANSYIITNLTASNISASNTITALNLVETSTRTVKTNIVPLTPQLNKIIKLNPVSFNYIFDNEPSVGLIAEEVGEIYPEFTTKEKNAISYGKMVSILIQSIKELKQIVDLQQQEINKLKDQ